jgi:hypothetical protein
MSLQTLFKQAKVMKISNGAAAGTSAVTSSTVDMTGYNAIMVIADLGTVTDASVLKLDLQEGAASNGSDAASVTGMATAAFTAATSSNTILVADATRPQKRYITAVLTRTTQNAVVNTIIAILYQSDNPPVTADASVLASLVAAGL